MRSGRVEVGGERARCLDEVVLDRHTVCDKKISYITFFCFAFISICHNILVALT